MSCEPSDESVNRENHPTVPPKLKPVGAEDDATIAPSYQKPQSDGAPVRVSGHVGGYELISELGRGGMGVVFKAKDIRLDRIVALKMIIGGQFASEEQIRRFTHEAESVARLDHPGIVPIYEIGENEGNHFFAMKLIEGKSLSDAREEFLNDQRKSVFLMVKICNAVHHAHQRGILHRDLKPANILLDVDGEPHVTDLGLAKQIDKEDGMTRTGSVMGSPGFMSPEQASGQSDVTTAVDVYSLGAVLYWLVSGRPPIEGDTHVDVILKTVGEEPKSLQSIRHDADRGLNLICQKALAKDPKARYESAADLCSDLEAWLMGDPISVKPPSAFGLVRLWMQRNAKTILTSSAMGLACGALVGGIVFILIVADLIKKIRINDAQLGDAGEAWVVQYFSWVGNINESTLSQLSFLIVIFTVTFGIFAIWLTKPKSREVGVMVATIAAMVAGIAAFLISLGWSPIIRHGIREGTQDISLVSNAFWMSPEERLLAQRSLLQRYPGLDQIPADQRGQIVVQKIERDQVLGVPKGIWLGIGDTVCFTVLPLFLAALFSGLLWHQGTRGFEYFGKSIELSIYAALFSLLLTKFVSNSAGYYPGFWFQILTCSGILLGLLIALLDKQVVWRIFGFLLVNVCLLISNFESTQIANANSIAASANTEREFYRAAKYLEKQVHVAPVELNRYRLATLYAFLNEDEKYERQCRRMLSEFENAYLPEVADRLAKVCMLKPDVFAGEAVFYELAESVSGYKTSADADWFYLCRSLSELRQGKFEQSMEWTDRCRMIASEKQDPSIFLRSASHLIDALARRGLGNEVAAARSAETFQTLYQTRKTNSRNWQDRLICEILWSEWQSSKP